MKRIIGLILIVILISSCKTESSDEVEVSAIYQAYLYIYNKTENKTTACAQFRDGGSLGNDVILNSPSSISVNGDVLVHQNIGYRLYYHYYKDYAGEVKVGSYLFTDKYNKTYTNVADLNTLPGIDFPAALDTISKANDFTLSWIGNPLTSNEPIEFTMSSTDTSISYSPSGAGATSLIVPKSDLAYFNAGNVNLFLKRSRSENIQASTAKGGVIDLEYNVTGMAYIKD